MDRIAVLDRIVDLAAELKKAEENRLQLTHEARMKRIQELRDLVTLLWLDFNKPD